MLYINYLVINNDDEDNNYDNNKCLFYKFYVMFFVWVHSHDSVEMITFYISISNSKRTLFPPLPPPPSLSLSLSFTHRNTHTQ
jgi:hypothetical protein